MIYENIHVIAQIYHKTLRYFGRGFHNFALFKGRFQNSNRHNFAQICLILKTLPRGSCIFLYCVDNSFLTTNNEEVQGGNGKKSLNKVGSICDPTWVNEADVGGGQWNKYYLGTKIMVIYSMFCSKVMMISNSQLSLTPNSKYWVMVSWRIDFFKQVNGKNIKQCPQIIIFLCN